MKKTALNIRLLLMFSVILLVAGVIMPSKRVSADEPEALGAVIESVDLMPYRNPLDATAVFYVPDELKEGKNEGEENLGSLESEFKERLYRALVAHEEYFDIEEFEIHDIGVVDRIFNELIAEHPDILYSEPYCSQYWTSTWNGVTTITHLYFVYEITVEEAAMLQNACERAYLGLNDSMSDEQKLIYLHDYLVTHCQYDTSYTYYDAFSAMVRHTAVCQGYAAAFEIMTRVLGFDANMVTSVYLNHAWNIVTLDGVEYYVDCTWDDPLFDTESYCGHNNLLRSRDGMIETEHTKGTASNGEAIYADDWEIDGEFVFNTRAINSTKYDAYYWSKIEHCLVETGGVQAYIYNWEHEDDPNSADYERYFYMRQGGSEQTYYSPVQMRWPVYGSAGSYYIGNFGNFAKVGDRLFLSTPQAIYQVGTDGSATLFRPLSDAEKEVGNIYGLLGDGNRLYYYLGKAPFSGEYTRNAVEFQDVQTPITDCTVTVASQVYTGSPLTPAVTVADYLGIALKQGTDYTVSYLNNTNAGTAIVVITGIGKYVGTTRATFNIEGISVNDLSVGSVGNYIYDGLEIKPDISVYDGNKLLTPLIDYTLDYFNNTEVGTATITITGTGNYTDSRDVTFEILPQSISNADIDEIPDKTYTGSAVTPTVTVYDENYNLLSKGIDYNVSYSNNVNAGTATVTITGIGNYTGIRKVTFKIKAKSLANLFVDAIPQQLYTGSAITPEVTVKDGNKTLVKGTDFTVAYSDNINPGTATVTITGKGNYTGTRTTHFSITQEVKSILDVTVVEIADQTYTGSAIKPNVIIKDGNRVLTKGTDYGIAFSGNTNVGTASVIISGSGAYTGTRIEHFNIVAKSISGAVISTIGNQIYNGAAITPSIAVSDGGRTLTKDTDYTVSYSNNINVGTATVTVTGKGNYKESKKTTFKIVAKSISGVVIGSIGDQIYTGSAITPEVTVRDGSKTLAKGTDYTVSYFDNVNVGTATVTVTGKGNYTGSKSTTFKIVKTAKNVSELTVDAISNQTYTGSAITPALTVKDGSKTLVKGTDYTVSYSNNVNVGTATATITGKGSYTGTRKVTFQIVAKEISKTAIDSIPDQKFTGSAITPEVTVKDGSKTLKKGTDYTVTYSNNVNVGTATVTVTGKGNYTGSKSTTFKIVKTAKNVSELTVDAIANQTYTGLAITPTLTIKDGNKTLTKGTDYTVSYTNNVNVGTATATITGKGNYTGTRKATFKIVAKAISKTTIDSIGDQVYTGSAITPVLTVKDGSKTLVKGTDYTVSYSNNVNVGTATVTITGKGNYTGSKSTTFKIVKTAKNVSELTVDAIANQTYTGSAITPALTIKDGNKTLTKGTDYTVSYTNNVNVGTATATITGKGNYTGTRKVTYKIVAKAISNADIDSIPDQKFTGSAITPEVTVKDGSKTLVKGTDYTVAYSNNINVGTATVKITGKGNYTGSKSTTFKIVNKSVADEFDDIDGTEWFVPYIQFVYDRGIMSGKGRNFDPNGKIKREELTQIIYSHAGKPAVPSNTGNPFLDVPTGAWYCNGILWCYKNGIVGGVGNGKFGVGQNVTREDFALMLFKYAQVCKMDSVNNIDDSAYKGFKDSDKVSKYAIKAMNWAITNGIMGGKGKSGAPKSELSLDPKGNATRAEGATMIMKFMGE